MNDAVNEFLQRAGKESQERSQAIERLASAADASKVFSTPVVSGDRTVITAAQISGGGGFGGGMGFGTPREKRGAGAEEPGSTAQHVGEGLGSGGGGGGSSRGRPVAAIVIGPDAVEVQPILDVTKISVTALVAFGVLAALSLGKIAKR